ncbi:MAG: response regulator transcription factor [Clostridiales bacterium]|nr:response regulator transcription factor [Clostridiales bacterium]
MKNILVVEDELEIRQLLASYLRNEGFSVSEAEDGVAAIDLFGKEKFDLVILDILIPKIDGYGVCELVKSKSDVPVIFLSALGDERSMIKGYDSFADDYVTKPFSMPVFLRKVKAVLRRDLSSSNEDYSKLTYKNIVMIPDLMKVMVEGTEVELTSKEFDLLLTLVKNPGRVYTREMLLEMLWDYNSLVDERIIDSHIKNIRHKVGEGIIETVRGRGYRVEKTDN